LLRLEEALYFVWVAVDLVRDPATDPLSAEQGLRSAVDLLLR
jgi:hypothetical protein